MIKAKPMATPLATSPPLALHFGTVLPDPSEFWTIVGSLQYLSLTRPYIGYTVNRLSQFLHQPTSEHWNAVKRLLRNLYGIINHGITLHRRFTLAPMLFQMLIGQVTKMTLLPLGLILFTLVTFLFLGVPKSNELLPAPLQKLSIALLQLLLLNFVGYARFSLNLVLFFLNNL